MAYSRFNQFFASRKSLLLFLCFFALGNVFLFWILGIKYLYITLSSKTLFLTSFSSYTSLVRKAYVIFFSLITYLSHFALLASLPFLVFVLPLLLVCKNRYIILPFTILIGSISTIALVTDSIVYSIYHFHINPTILKIAFGEKYSFIAFFEFSQYELTCMFAACVLILIFETALALLAWKKHLSAQLGRVSKKITVALLGCLYLSYSILIFSMVNNNNILTQQTPNLPLYNNIFAFLFPFNNGLFVIENFSETRFSQPLFPVSPLNYPLHPLSCRPEDKPYNLVIIGIDSWRFDAMNSELTPQIQTFAKHAWQFTQHYSGGNSTQAGLFSLFYGLPNNYWTSMLKQHQGALLIHELLAQAYQSKVLFSSDMIPPFNETIFEKIKPIRTDHAAGANIAERDQSVTREFFNFINKRDVTKPFFAFLFYDSAHGYCDPQYLPRIYPTTNQSCRRLLLTNRNDETDIVNRYKNAVHFIDNEVGQVLNHLKAENMLDNTIVIITGDHGEEFNDNHLDYWGHGSNYTPYQLQTPLIIRWPHQTPKMWTHQTSHYDVAPFLLKQLLGCRNPNSDYSIGKELLNDNDRSYLLVGSYINMAIIQKQRNITLFTSGNIQIADMHANVLSNAKVDTDILTNALLDMRRFYQSKSL